MRIQSDYKIADIPTENISGIYALVDDNGKIYVGSSKDIRTRIKSHQYHMNYYLHYGVDGFLNSKMAEAITSGLSFRCVILAQFNCDLSQKERREVERIFINKYGGLENTYNEIPIVHKI